jgi:hypothetical protein
MPQGEVPVGVPSSLEAQFPSDLARLGPPARHVANPA